MSPSSFRLPNESKYLIKTSQTKSESYSGGTYLSLVRPCTGDTPSIASYLEDVRGNIIA